MRGLTSRLATLSVPWGAGYLLWRLVATRDGVDGWAWALLGAAEIVAFLGFCLRVSVIPVAAAGVRARPEPGLAAGWSEISVIVDARAGSGADLRTTLVALGRVGAANVTVLGVRDGARFATMVERLGGIRGDPEADLAGAIAEAAHDRVLLLSPGDVPPPDLLERIGPIDAVDVGAVLLAPGPSRRGIQRTIDVVLRPLVASGASFCWCGRGPAIIDRSAFVSLPAADGTDGPSGELGARLIETGHRILATTAGLVACREHKSCRPGWGLLPTVRRLSRRSGASALVHIAGVLAPLIAWSTALLTGASMLAAVLGATPVAPTAQLVVMVGVTYGCRSLIWYSLDRDGIPSGQSGYSIWSASTPWLVAALASAMLTLTFGVVVAWWRTGDAAPASLLAVALGATLLFAGRATAVVLTRLGWGQRRSHRRVEIGLVSGRLEGNEGRIVDLSEAGARILLPAGSRISSVGSTTTMSFRVPAGPSRWQLVSTVVRVRHSRAGDGGLLVGVEFDDPIAPPLDAVVAFLLTAPIVDQPFRDAADYGAVTRTG